MADHLFRENSGKMIAVLTRLFGLNQIDIIMDAVQDTFESALTTWKYSGVPRNPAGWLMQVSKNKAVSRLRKDSKLTLTSDSVFLKKYEGSFETDTEFSFHANEVEDSQLRLLLTCCHPDFSEKNQIIITLAILCGFGIAEISNALLMNEEAVKKALFRTKADLKSKGMVLLTPQLPKYEKRVETVQTILYLMFNEGYKTTKGKEIINKDLCYESIRLAKLLLNDGVALNKETHALLALMFFNLARFPSRISSDGELVTLAEQDRAKWNKTFIEEGYHHLNLASDLTKLNRYHLEAVIASIHCMAQSFEATDWKTIVFLYEQLETLVNSPMVTLNKIVAESYLDPASGIERIGVLKKNPVIEKYYLLHAAEGDMFLRLKNKPEAKASFIKAQEFATSPLDKQFLINKISQC
jgi:RNA polymerase sigma factor (sigma-70 family)